MAELDGLELALRLRRLDVSTPIILITGYPDEHISEKANSAGVRQVLLKPNLEGNLIECVRNAIETPSERGKQSLKTTAGAASVKPRKGSP